MKPLIILLLLTIATANAKSQNLPHFKVAGARIEGLNPEETQKMYKALAIFEQVMNDNEFQKKLLNLTFVFDVDTDSNRSLSTQQIVEKLYQGNEWYSHNANNTADIYWTIVKKKKPLFNPHPAIGYGLPNDTTIFTYTWFFDDPDNLSDVVGHIAHEWSHKLGFQHAYKPHATREQTVPYAFGDLVAEYADKYLSDAAVKESLAVNGAKVKMAGRYKKLINKHAITCSTELLVVDKATKKRHFIYAQQ